MIVVMFNEGSDDYKNFQGSSEECGNSNGYPEQWENRVAQKIQLFPQDLNSLFTEG